MLATTANEQPNEQFAIIQSSGIRPWIVCFSAALFFFYEFIQMNMFNSISNELMRDFALNATQLGNLSATYFYADVLFLFPAGMLLDRFSTRKIILVAMVLGTVGTLFFALTSSVILAGIFHFISGIGNAFCFLSCIMLASRWFPPRKMALVIGLIVTMAMIGGAVAQTPLTILSGLIGWRNALLLDAGLGFIILGIIWCFVRDYPAEYQESHEMERRQLTDMGFWTSIRLAVQNPQNWLCGIYTSLLNLPIMLLGALWGKLYLTQVHHISATAASTASSMIFIGTIVGAPVAGWISDHLGLRRLPMTIGAILSLLVIFIIMYAPNLSLTTLTLSFFLLGFFTSTQVISYPTIAEGNIRTLTGTSMGLASVLIMGGAAVFQPIFGWIMDLHWNGLVVNETRVYTADNYQLAMLILPIAFVVGLLATYFIRETYCKAVTEDHKPSTLEH